MDDVTIIRNVLDGRLEDFGILVRRYQKMLYAFVSRQLGVPAAADDVVQASFVNAYTHLGGFRFEASFKSWLHEIALNECRSRARRGSRREVPLEEAPASALVSEDPDPGDGRLRARLEREIANLPRRQRSVLALRVFSDLPFREIARIEGISINAAKVNYHHAVRRLKEWLG